MTKYRQHLPQLDGSIFLSDGGLETSLIYTDGIDLPLFAAFPLLSDAKGRAALDRYFRNFLDIAVRQKTGFILDTATWRANPDWAAKLGIGPAALDAVNADAVSLAFDLRRDYEERGAGPIVVNGVIGPRGDGYVIDRAMGADEARLYHRRQVDTFADAGVDMISAITMNYIEEGLGIALAARDAGVPSVISFTVETDGRLPSGSSIADAIGAVDAATGAGPAYYMINCAHPSHFDTALAQGAPWLARIGGVRANASTKSHAELDVATVLDPGDPIDLGRRYRDLRMALPKMNVLGGCCGTDHHHIGAICEHVQARA